VPGHLPLTALRAFDAAARLGSFRAAAEALSLTPSAVSHQIRALEHRLGTVLFDRSRHRAALTVAGQRLHAATGSAFAALARACEDLAAPATRQLRIHSAPSFAATWLAPRLPGFIAANPDLEVSLSASPEPADLERGEAECDIRYVPLHPVPAGLRSIPLGEETIAPLCAPALARGLRAPGDLAGAVLIDSAHNAVRWPDWFARHGLDRRAGRPGPHFDRSFLAIAAAVDGVGVALDSTRLAARDLAAGRLVQPLAGRSDDPAVSAHALAYPAGAGDGTLRFARWLVRALGLAGPERDASAPAMPLARRALRDAKAPRMEGHAWYSPDAPPSPSARPRSRHRRSARRASPTGRSG
jgi:DNA-binding transcriptional LysR family regulator